MGIFDIFFTKSGPCQMTQRKQTCMYGLAWSRDSDSAGQALIT